MAGSSTFGVGLHQRDLLQRVPIHVKTYPYLLYHEGIYSKVRNVAAFCRQLTSHMSDARRRLRLIVSMLDTHASRAVDAALFLHLSFNRSIEHPDSQNILPHCS